MGAKKFADALRVCHLENYDKLHISYLSRLAHGRGMQNWLEKKFDSFLPFADCSSKGYHGFVPSSQWLRDSFDRFMELHSHDFAQAMALLPGWICAIDHSFKVNTPVTLSPLNLIRVLACQTHCKGQWGTSFHRAPHHYQRKRRNPCVQSRCHKITFPI
jgi:hypothetical protein